MSIRGVHTIMFGAEADAVRAFLRDDIVQARAELEARGVEFTAPVRDQGWGLVTAMQVPGGGELGLYQPLHATAI